MKKLELHEIGPLYKRYEKAYNRYLKESGVRFVKYTPNKISQALWALMFMLKYENEVVTKEELTEGWNSNFKPTNDFQSGRHLGLQFGYNAENNTSGIPGYRLLSLTEPHPSFISNRRTEYFDDSEWESEKNKWDYRCLSCGAKEGEKHYKHKTLIVKLQKGHCDPSKPLTMDNTFPQCNYCNQHYKDKFIFDKRGNVKQQI